MFCTTNPVSQGQMSLLSLIGPLFMYDHAVLNTGPENVQMIPMTTGRL